MTGAWLTVDPVRFLGGFTSLFGYLNGDPVNSRDPRGFAGVGLSVGLNGGVGYGGQVGAGGVVDFSGGASGIFQNAGSGPYLGAGFGGGAVCNIIWGNVSDFWGLGYELGVNLPWFSVGVDFGSGGDPYGISIGVGKGFGAGIYAFETQTGP